MNRRIIALAVVLVLAAAPPAAAQSRPLVTEDPEIVPVGHILIEAGVDALRDAVFPVSGLTGSFWRIGTFGLSFGVSSIAEIQIDGGIRNRLAVTGRDPDAPLASRLNFTGDATSDIDDLVIGAKVRLVSETVSRPSLSVRFATHLPNAGTESGLGRGTTDFLWGVALGKTVQSVRIVGNVGFGILGDPTRGDRQHDVLNFGASVARAIAPGLEVVGEISGRVNAGSGTPPPGTDSRSTLRVGGRLTRGPVRVDTALLVGVTDRDPSWGVTAGLTWVFRAFDVQ